MSPVSDVVPPAETPEPKRRRALGRGLDALLPTAPHAGLRQIDVADIEPNPQQPRQRFDPEELRSLAHSLTAHGMLQPLVVTALSAKRYRLILGERRWQAARLAGLRDVPAIVREASDHESLELALIENIQRRDLNPLEEATAYQRLMQEHGLTQGDVAKQVGRSRVAVTNTLRLLSLPETVRRAVVDERITEGHARALLALPSPDQQIAALEAIERRGLSVRQTEELTRRMGERTAPQSYTRPVDPDLALMQDELRRALGFRVTLKSSRRGGRIVIDFASSEEFETLYRRLLHAAAGEHAGDATGSHP